MIYNFLTEGYFENPKKKSPVNINTTKDRMKSRTLKLITDEFIDIVNDPNTEFQVSKYSSKDSQKPILKSEFAPVVPATFLPGDPVCRLFMDIFQKYGLFERNYDKFDISVKNRGVLFACDISNPSQLSDLSDLLRIHWNLHEMHDDNIGFRMYSFTQSHTAKSYIDSTGALHINFIYDVTFRLPDNGSNPSLCPISVLSFIKAAVSLHDEVPNKYPQIVKDEFVDLYQEMDNYREYEYGIKQLTELFRHEIAIEFTRAKIESGKPSLRNIYWNVMSGKNANQVIKKLDNDLKFASKLFSVQPIFEENYGISIPIRLSGNIAIHPQAHKTIDKLFSVCTPSIFKETDPSELMESPWGTIGLE